MHGAHNHRDATSEVEHTEDGGERGLDLICVDERPGNEVSSSVCVEKVANRGDAH